MAAKDSLNGLVTSLREFADERDWDQFHSPKNLASALSVEAAEVLEHFQWLTAEQSSTLSDVEKSKVSQELADVLLFLVRLTDKLGIDLIQAAKNKIAINATKYPVSKARGTARKYTEL